MVEQCIERYVSAQANVASKGHARIARNLGKAAFDDLDLEQQ